MLVSGLLALAALAGGAPSGPAEGSRLAVIQQAPAFSLTDQDGKVVRLADLRGKVLLVSFIFTTCSGSCPATTHRMAKVQEALQKAGHLDRGRVRLLSITLDPARDTAPVLRRYMQLYDVDSASWSFLTGPQDRIARTIADWGMWVKPAPNGQLDHPSRIFLVDTRGRIREIYNLAFLKPAWVVEDVELLLSEARKGTTDRSR